MSWKLSCPVLRGGENGDAQTLPDKTPMRVRLWTVHESPTLANQSACGLEA
jgi:hypothetical protein